MTFVEFQNKVKRSNRFDKYWYYAVCFAITALGIFWTYLIVFNPIKFNVPAVYGAAAFCLLLGIYGLYLLPNRYKIVVIADGSPTDMKLTVVRKALSNFEVQLPEKSEGYLFFTIKKRFWHSPFEVHLFFDEDCYAFTVQGHDYDGGFIDFGGTERKRKQIAQSIIAAKL